MRVEWTSTVSPEAGLGRIEIHKDIAAVLRRDEGTVTLLRLRGDRPPAELGSYGEGTQNSLDGDLAFSRDGKWLFYARQTEQFSQDGIHILDVADPKAPALATYHPGGGAFRIDYFRSGDAEYVAVLDATDGLVVNRFVRETGALVRVFQDPAPALKVGGPASAGFFIDEKDPLTGAPLMYVTTGKTGLQIYDLTQPESPQIVGEWPDVGLAEVEVAATKDRRTVYAATEYWFDSALKPQVIVLDATKLDAIRETDRFGLGLPADDLWRVQGMDLAAGRLFVAHSHAGLVVYDKRGRVRMGAVLPGPQHAEAGAVGTPYAMDVEVVGGTYGRAFVTDAATGMLVDVRKPPSGRHPN